ncbi:MAG: hypothetical protein ACLPXT_14740 [Terracidiphilus sp.]
MARTRIPLLLCLALLAPVSALAAGAALAAGSPEVRGPSATVSGVYLVTFHLNILSTLPAGSTITCRARITPNSAGLDLRNPNQSVTPAAAAGQATVTGPTATCAAEIPFAWTLASGQDGLATGQGGMVLSYEIDAVSNSGTVPLLVRSSAGQSIGVLLPASGASLNLAF